MNKLEFILVTLSLFLFVLFYDCADDTPKALKVSNVYYAEGYGDVYYYGGTDHTDDNLYIIGVDLDTNGYGHDFIDVNWTGICSAEDNVVLWGGYSQTAPFPFTFLLRLQNPYDPATDAGKRIYFNRSKFKMGASGGGVFGSNGYIEAYISTGSKEINFDY